MRRGGWALPAALCLAGCASYVPQPIEIADQAAYTADVNSCTNAAANYKPQLDIGNIGAATITGAASNASNAVINPLVPAIGAAAGAVSSTANAFDVIGQAKRNVAKHCLQEKLHRDRAAIVADPDN